MSIDKKKIIYEDDEITIETTGKNYDFKTMTLFAQLKINPMIPLSLYLLENTNI